MSASLGWFPDIAHLFGTSEIDGWTVRVSGNPKHPNCADITAWTGTRAEKNLRVVKVEKVTADRVETFDPETAWRHHR